MKIAWLAYKTNEVIEKNIQERKDRYDAEMVFGEEEQDWEKEGFKPSERYADYDPNREGFDEEIDDDEFYINDDRITKEERDNIVLSYVFKKAYNPFIVDPKPRIENPLGKGFKDTLLVGPKEFYRLKRDLFVLQDITSKSFMRLYEEAENNFVLKDSFDEAEAEELGRNIPARYYPFFLPTALQDKVLLYDIRNKTGNKAEKYLGGGLAATHLVDKVLDYVWDEMMNIPREIVLASNLLRGLDIIALPAVGLYNEELISGWIGRTEEEFLLEYRYDPLVKGFITYFSRPEREFGTLINRLPKKEQRWLSSLEKEDKLRFFEGVVQGQDCLQAIIYNWHQEQSRR